MLYVYEWSPDSVHVWFRNTAQVFARSFDICCRYGLPHLVPMLSLRSRWIIYRASPKQPRWWQHLATSLRVHSAGSFRSSRLYTPSTSYNGRAYKIRSVRDNFRRYIASMYSRMKSYMKRCIEGRVLKKHSPTGIPAVFQATQAVVWNRLRFRNCIVTSCRST